MSDQPTAISARDLLKIRNFRLLWGGQIVSNFGDAITQLTLILYINRITDGSTQAIAGLLIALALPMATLGLVAGVFVDRWDRKRTMIVSDLLRGILTLGFVAAAVWQQLWLIYLLAFLHATVSSFFGPVGSKLAVANDDGLYPGARHGRCRISGWVAQHLHPGLPHRRGYLFHLSSVHCAPNIAGNQTGRNCLKNGR